MTDGETHDGPVRAFDFIDADAYAQAHDTSDSEYVRLANVPFQARLTHFDLGVSRIRMCRFSRPHGSQDMPRNTAIVRFACKTDRATLVVPLGEPAGVSVNGRATIANDVFLLAPGAEFHSTVRGKHQDWTVLDVGAEAFERLLDQWNLPRLARGADGVRRVAPGSEAAALASAVEAAAGLAGAMPQVVAMPGVIPSIRTGVHDLLEQALAAQTALMAASSRQTRDLLRLVRVADGYLCEHLDRPIYTDELCEALAVSPRKLHNAFVATYGVSPHVYLKCRRLALVRRALGTGDPASPLVKSVALSHGFWHMGHFAHDYFAMFGEMPSTTFQGRTGRRSA